MDMSRLVMQSFLRKSEIKTPVTSKYFKDIGNPLAEILAGHKSTDTQPQIEDIFTFSGCDSVDICNTYTHPLSPI